MFGLVKKVFAVAMTVFCNTLECVSINSQESKIRSQVVNIKSNNPLFYPYSIDVNKCIGSCNNINDSYSKLSVPNIVKNIGTKCWNKDKCRCECKELIDKGRCDKGFIWNPSNCECEKTCTAAVDPQHLKVEVAD